MKEQVGFVRTWRIKKDGDNLVSSKMNEVKNVEKVANKKRRLKSN